MRTAFCLLIVAMFIRHAQSQTMEPKLVNTSELKLILAQDHGAVLVQFTSTDKACTPCVDSNSAIPQIVGKEHWIHPFLRVSWTPWTSPPPGLPIAGLEGMPTLVVFIDGKGVKEYVGYSPDKADDITRMLQPFNNGRLSSYRQAMPAVPGPPIASLKLSPPKISLLWGQTFTTSIEARDAQSKLIVPLPAISMSSSAESIAAADPLGRIHSIRRGHAVITARSGSAAAKVEVDVSGFSDLGTTSTDTTCALTDSRLEIYCWGNAASNRIFARSAANAGSYASPVQIQIGELSGNRIASLVTAAWSSCALTEAGRIYCWGDPHNSLSLGTGDARPRTLPTAIQLGDIPPGAKITSLAASATDICVTTAESHFYCWGATNSMPIGPDLQPGQTLLKPARMTLGEIPPGTNLSAISVATTGGCVIAGGDGYCWTSGTIPKLVGPGDLPGNVKLTAASVTDEMSCALGDDGRAYCFGKGVGTQAWRLVAAASKLKQISVGSDSLACGVGDDHHVYCWNRTARGTLEARRLAAGQVPADVMLQKVICAPGHCAALGDDGRIYSWGPGKNATELGHPLNTHIDGPQLINGPLQ